MVGSQQSKLQCSLEAYDQLKEPVYILSPEDGTGTCL